MPVRSAIALFLLLAGVRAAAQVPQPSASNAVEALQQVRSAAIPKVTRPPRLEEFVKGTAREAEAVLTDFRQRAPGDGVPVSQQTAAYLSYDDENLYIVFVCRDARGEVRAHMSKRDDIGNDDSVAVYLDTFGDRQHAYYFSVNPLGIQVDGLVTQDSDPDLTFDTVWTSEGRLTEDGYAVRMAIPFKSLRFPAGSGTWSIALSRTILTTGETAFWPFITKRKASLMGQFGRLEGLDLKPPGRNIQLIPYTTFTGERVLNADKTSYDVINQGRVGADAKVVIHDSLTLDLTANPDFSQVESDDPQVTINQRYTVYFPEKRPFFLDSSGYFSTPINLFFSRQIADPEFGARLTGKIGQWSIGALAMDDRAPGANVSPTSSDYGDRAAVGAVRVERDFGDQSEAGVMTTGFDFGGTSNRVISLDTRIKLSPTWFFTGQVVDSFSRTDSGAGSAQSSQGKAYDLAFSHSDRHLNFSTSYLDISPDFRAQLGFIPRVDIRQWKNYVSYYWRPEGKSILDYGVSATMNSNVNRAGQLQDLNSYLEFDMDLKGHTGFSASRYDAHELYLGTGFRYGVTGGSFYWNRLRWFYLSGSYSQGSGVNYYPANGIPFVGSSENGSLTVSVMPKPRLRLEQTYYYSRLGSPSGPTVFVNHLSRTKINYQFNQRFSVRGILDYDPTLSNPTLFDSPTSKPLTGDVLLTYLINPGTAFYLGYDGRYRNLELNPLMPQQAPLPLGPPTYLTSRELFVKLSYEFRF